MESVESINLDNEFIPRLITQFLNAKDALHFSQTCKLINESLGFKTLLDKNINFHDMRAIAIVMITTKVMI